MPSAPEAPTDASVVRKVDEAPAPGSRPRSTAARLTGYVVTARRDGVPEKTVEVDENTTEAVVEGLSAAESYDFTVAAQNLIGTGPGMGQPVLATGVEITGPEQLVRPYGSACFEAAFTPDDTTLKKALWSVTEPDGSPTDKATIDDTGVLRANHRDGNVVVTATAADAGGVSASVTVTIALDPSLYRSNASRWPGVSATASSQFNDDFRPAKVHDGFGAAAGEWTSAGEQNPWIRLEWTTPVQADTITLYDRPGVDDATGGTLSFSDGSSVSVDGIPADGGAKTVSLGLKTFTWVRLQVVGGSGPQRRPRRVRGPGHTVSTAGTDRHRGCAVRGRSTGVVEPAGVRRWCSADRVCRDAVPAGCRSGSVAGGGWVEQPRCHWTVGRSGV